MDSKEFSYFRSRFKKTQKQMGQLLGTSVKAIHSYEQGWRSVPTHVERQVFFLASRKREVQKELKSCWITKKCPSDRKTQCPAWEFQAGTICWFINGTICEGEEQKDWRQKMELCRRCEMLASLL